MARKGPNETDEKNTLRLTRGRRGKGEEARAQLRPAGRRIWTEARKQEFLDVLRTTCNVREACRVVNMNNTGIYQIRKNDPAFAAAWKEAVEQGYSELEMLLLRQSLFGSETTETVDDGEGNCKQVKTRHSYPLQVAVRLLFAHRKTAEEVRGALGTENPGSEQIRAEIQAQIATVRLRLRGPGGPDGDEKA